MTGWAARFGLRKRPKVIGKWATEYLKTKTKLITCQLY